MLKLLFLTFALFQLSNAGFLDFFKSPDCVNVAGLNNFDINQFAGTWYALYRSPCYLKCEKLDFNVVDSETYNTSVSAVEMYTGFKYGHVFNTTLNKGNSGVLSMELISNNNLNFMNLGLGNTYALDYKVIATDYSNFALLYSCNKFVSFFKYEVVVILSRTKSLDDSKIKGLIGVFNAYGIGTTSLKAVDQSCQ